MSKSPKKPRAEQLPEVALPEARRPRARVKGPSVPTMLETLLANPHAYGDQIKVWVRANLPSEPTENGFYDRVERYMEENGFPETFRELLHVSPDTSLAPGQALLLLAAHNLPSVQIYLYRVSPKESEIVFDGVPFTVVHPAVGVRGADIGNPRPYQAAAKAILKETNGADWFGGIDDFAARYLLPPKTSKKVLH